MTKTPSSQPKKIKKQSETTIFHDEMAIFCGDDCNLTA
jgi:hypothetical protein